LTRGESWRKGSRMKSCALRDWKPSPTCRDLKTFLDATVRSLHEDRGTMTCQLGSGEVELETPLVGAEVGSSLRVGIRAGDLPAVQRSIPAG